jgi:hypothetical protein
MRTRVRHIADRGYENPVSGYPGVNSAVTVEERTSQADKTINRQYVGKIRRVRQATAETCSQAPYILIT